MSYDLYLVRKEEAAGDLRAAYERPEEAERRRPTAAEEERLRRLAADLQAANQGLDLSEPEDGFLLQLGCDAERPVVIDIAGVADIRMSWSYGAADAAPALAEVDLYLPIFNRHGYVAYDPQLERAFEPGRVASEAAGIHHHVQERLHDALRTDLRGARPLWKRLLGGR